MPNHYNVLFLCTGNSARSIMAEALLNHKARGTFTAYSAGSHPSGTPRPEALAPLASAGISTAANEICPLWPGHPMTAHWGIPDPAAVKGTPDEIARAFRDVFTILDRRIGLFLALPLATLEQLAIQKGINQIGRS